MPFGTRLLLTNPQNGRQLCVEVVDRGPFVRGRDLDITRAGQRILGFGDRGVVSLQYTIGHCSF